MERFASEIEEFSELGSVLYRAVDRVLPRTEPMSPIVEECSIRLYSLRLR